MDTRHAAAWAADVIRQRSGREPEVGLICGTGFGPCADVLTDRVTIPYEDLGFRPSAIPSHINEVDVGLLDGVVVAAVKGKSLPCDGATWQEAFSVQCDSQNNPDVDVRSGLLSVDVQMRPVFPAEFIRVRFRQSPMRSEVGE